MAALDVRRKQKALIDFRILPWENATNVYIYANAALDAITVSRYVNWVNGQPQDKKQTCHRVGAAIPVNMDNETNRWSPYRWQNNQYSKPLETLQVTYLVPAAYRRLLLSQRSVQCGFQEDDNDL